MDVDDIKDIGEEEYTIINLDSRDMIYNGTQWSIKNSEGTAGLNEFIPYVTSIEVAESFIPDTLYNIDYRNKISYGFILETYELNRDVQGAPPFYTEEHIKNSIPYLQDDGNIEYPNYSTGNIDYGIYGRSFVKNIPRIPISYYTLPSSVMNKDYSMCYSMTKIIEKDIEIGIKLTFRVNKENIDVKNEIREYGISKRLLHIYTNDGKINTRNIIELNGTLEVDDIINDTYITYDFLIYTYADMNISEFDYNFHHISTSDDLDILPENMMIDVYYYGTIIYEQQNYDVESFTHTTNEHLSNIFDLHLSRNEEYINNYVSFEEYKKLNLQMEYNTSSKKFEFVSYYNYKFFIDARDADSIVYVLGLENVLYFSNEYDYEYSEKLNTTNEIKSFTRNKIENYYTGFSEPTDNELTLYQIFQSKFLDQSILDNKVNDQIYGENFINNIASEIKPTYVNNYNFSKNRIYDGIGNFYTSTSSYIFNIIRTTQNTNQGTNYYIGVRIKTSDYVFFTKPSLYNIANVMGHKKKDPNDVDEMFHRNAVHYPNKTNSTFFYITNSIFNNDMYTNVDLDNRTFIDSVEYKIKINKISATNISNLSGNRYVDLTCIEIENELKRYNPEMNKLYRYYFDDATNLYITSSKGNIGDIVLQNPREFNPISRLSTLTLEFRTADGNIYDFKNIPFFISLVIKYLKPKLTVEKLEN